MGYSESIYQGGDNILLPKYYNQTGYQSGMDTLGLSTDPRTANQLGELNLKLNPGQKHMEVGAINQSVFDSIPDIHLDEMKRLSRLTGVTTSLHSPIVEASGVGERGWDEVNRIGAERQVEQALIRAHRLDPKGNVSVTTHTTGGLPEMITKYKEGDKEKTTSLYIIDTESGKMGPMETGKRFFPKEGGNGEAFTGKPREFDVKDEIEKINKDQWTSQLSDINRHASQGEELLDRAKHYAGLSEKTPPAVAEKYLARLTQKDFDINEIAPEDREFFKTVQREAIHGQIYLRDAYRNLKSQFDRAFASASDPDKEKLKRYANEIKPLIKEGIDEDTKALGEVIEKGIKVLGEIKNPNIIKPLNEFVIDKSSQTFANAATSAFKKFGDTAPILNIENPPAGSGLSRADDLKKLVVESRKKMADNLQKDGMSRSQAEKTAEKFIGATWDVGHINMIRKMGYSEKDVIKEAEKIAPFVKHVHLSDNFGLEHTELPMGMGNVPTKEILQKLGEKGFEGKKIVEAGNWWQYFAEKGGGNPFRPSLESFNSPVYAMKNSYTWSQTPNFGSYYAGHGAVNPAVHHKLYGSGFENLPMELGGEIPGDRGRFSGTSNQ